MKLLQLGTMVKDKPSRTEGMLINAVIDMDQQVEYIYQPKGLSPKTGEPVDVIMVVSSRIEGGTMEEVDVPVQYLGTDAQDIATGYTGTVINIVYHINGCMHIGIKPPGQNSEGNTFATKEFDIRRVTGEVIKPLEGEALKESKVKTPSPTGVNLSKVGS